MGLTTFTEEYTNAIAPARLFKASIYDSHNLIPKLMPQAIKSIEITQGNGGTGSIKQINFVEGSTLNYLKFRIDELSEETFTYNYTLIEADPLMEKQIESIVYEVKLEPALNGGTISKMTSKYYTKGDGELSEEVIKAGKERAMGMYKAVETYLLQNPDAYA
ncbi:major strawberry allergen Fra a 1.07-like [Cornus florida]|uniref:major strawberry allergen Fra a 1.07-like n=1 Tax=Cornus florida TaxID=4283 RepID=UPI002899CDF2|nr:major strawberry allergen Fra a 1.07-like [Cornus florida]XP_059632443.1 major strawberry allergen Fra a 1.07-like [Cornus florida]XP_059632444.1 major strawberry allergen Fra a 1.07-like [Cornus florida]XP_059632445.1 major strawberry allergen Fra a 1.07-like [Cornus florida]XP_059632446.1 major strawberry allergen Fra a 1.07-like [Cornus florida]XP_059632447.1 major strawberry allergen Fra a 1.07-like [Cornus florida]